MEEGKKETLFEDLWAFTGLLPIYLFRRVRGVLAVLFRAVFSGFTLTEQLKSWLARLFIRRKGQLSFPFAHATLVGVSLSLLVVTAGLGGAIFKKPKTFSSLNPFILESTAELNTEESELLRNEAITYVVSKGETIYDIASKFGISPDALAFANRLAVPYEVKTDQKITIPPYQGIIAEIDKDTTVSELAEAYGADPQSIIDINYLFSGSDGVYRVKAGRTITIPTYQNGLLGSVSSPRGTCGDIKLIWPASGYVVTQYWSPYHPALDISGGGLGSALFAAAGGEVVGVGQPSSWNQGYAGSVVINIPNTGYQLLYAHMSRIDVGVGQPVESGESIGGMGATGNAFGVHLHFELRCNGEKIDPSYYIRK
jgi:murein DD-endopeptidase MepM/ murein hydrolase activator NlpD